jgi:osmotically-inducible protein OsmY
VLRSLLALLLLAGLLGAGVLYWRARSGATRPPSLEDVGGELKDTAVTASVKTAFGLSRSLERRRVSVSTEHGVVTLRGEVATPEQKRLAGRIAEAVPDVVSVVNHLRVADSAEPAAGADGRTLGESLDDRSLEVQVRLALSLNRHMEGARIEARSFRREVTLAGEVLSEAQRRLAAEVAGETAGVAGVRSELRVAAGAPAGPAAAKQAVERALAANPNLARARIEVAEEEGGLVLRGSVGSGAERDLAGLLARDAAGRAVKNALEIGPRRD